MSNNASVFLSFGDIRNALIVKCVISFGTPITCFRFSLNTRFIIDSIKADTDTEWKVMKEWQPEWQSKSKEFVVSVTNPMHELTIEYQYHGQISGWCNVIEEKRIALSVYSAWSIFETSVPVNYIFKIENMDNYFVVNARYDDIEKLWVYGETDHDEGNIIALKEGQYHLASTGNFFFYYMNENEKDYANYYITSYNAIMEYLTSIFGKRSIHKMSIVSLGREDGGGAYFRKELMVIDKIDVSEDKEQIRQSVIGLLGHELGHNWFMGADTSTWEDWLNETCAEWAALLYIHSLNDKVFFENRLSTANENYMDTPMIKSSDGTRPSDGVHTRGVMMFYEIYLQYGMETIITILKIFIDMKEKNTKSFLSELKMKIGIEIPEKIEKALTIKNYTGLFV